MSMLSLKMRAEPLRSLASGAILAGYMGVGTALAHGARQIFVENLTDALLTFSFDGITDHFVLPANGFFLSDITSNKSLGQGFFLSAGERLYVKQNGVPASGAVYFSVFYGSDS